MSDQPVRSAEGEPWWPEFVAAYGKVPLRELARRFQTNSRRLRRAVQRSGLSAEPETIREVMDRLGTCPDIVLAKELKVTSETVAGARRRRRIPAFDPALVERPKPEPKKKERPEPKPVARPPRESKPSADRWAERKARYRPDPNEVVVVRRRVGPDGSGSPQPGGGITAHREHRLLRENAPSEDSQEHRSDAQPRRRRIVSKSSERDEPSDPEPAVAVVRRQPRPKPTAAASEVRYVDAASASELVEDLKSALKEAPLRPPPAPEPVRAAPSVFRPAPPLSKPALAPAPPTLLARPSSPPQAQPSNGALKPAPGSPEQLWLACIRQAQGLKDLVICASSLVIAAEIASQHGVIERLGPAPRL